MKIILFCVFLICYMVLKGCDMACRTFFRMALIQVTATYWYIFIKYKKRKERVKCYKTQPSNSDHFRLLIPAFLILSYIIFLCIPDFVIGNFQFGNVSFSESYFRIVTTAYKNPLPAEPIICIYNCKLSKKRKTYLHSKNSTISNNKTSHFWRFCNLFRVV